MLQNHRHAWRNRHCSGTKKCVVDRSRVLVLNDANLVDGAMGLGKVLDDPVGQQFRA